MRVKVCGMTQLDQVRKLDEMGVDFAGLIFYPKSPEVCRQKYFRGAAEKSKTAHRQSRGFCKYAL